MNKGFSLIELLVTIAIIAIFASIVVSVFVDSGIENANYRIETDDGLYYVEAYTKEHDGTCVYMAENEIRYCGNYTVEKLNKDE